MNIIDNDLLSIQEARILAENAYHAQQWLALLPQEQLHTFVEAMADAVQPHIEELAVLSADETDFGNWKDKYAKNHFVCTYLREQLRGKRYVGVISDDPQKGIVDIGVPMGVIAALCPATSPVSTTIYKTLIAIKSGNAIVFSPHPRAKETIGRALDIMIAAGEAAGMPEGAVCYMHTVTASGTIELMNHEHTAMILNTGVPGMLKAAQDSNKPLIYGGAGNGPVFIERTADIQQAVRDIIASKTFDNGVLPAAEQTVVVDAPIADEVKEESATNKSSLILLFHPERRNFLLAGDACSATLKDAVKAYPQSIPGCTFKVPHHGSKHNLTTDLIDMIRPSSAVISCKGTKKHPNPAVVHFLSKYCDVFSTSKCYGGLTYTNGRVNNPATALRKKQK